MLSVVAFHVAPQFWRGGFVGVDIFFVISGFLISSIICKGLDDGTFSFVDFYERRIRRIFPALIVVLLACLLLGWLVLLADEYEELGSHTKAAAGFYSNILLLRETGYFDTGAQYKILLHLWSLGIEEQFYLGRPLFLFLIWKRPAARPWAIGFVTLLSFGLNIWFLHSKPNSVFYLPFTRLWELSIGALLFETRALPGAGWPGAALVGASMLFLDGDMRFPGWWGGDARGGVGAAHLGRAGRLGQPARACAERVGSGGADQLSAVPMALADFVLRESLRLGSLSRLCRAQFDPGLADLAICRDQDSRAARYSQRRCRAGAHGAADRSGRDCVSEVARGELACGITAI